MVRIRKATAGKTIQNEFEESIVERLGPGSLPDFNTYAETYTNVREVFDSILVTPYLGSISFKTRHGRRKSLLTVIQNGLASLQRSAERDVERAKELRMYLKSMTTKLGVMQVASYVDEAKPSAEHFGENARLHILVTTQELSELKSFLSDVSDAISCTTYELDQLATHLSEIGSSDIEYEEVYIDDTEVWDILTKAMGNLADDINSAKFISMLTETSGVAWNTLVSRWQSNHKLAAQELGESIRKSSVVLGKLRYHLDHIRSTPFPYEMGVDVAFNTIWDRLLLNLKSLDGWHEFLVHEELALLKSQWEQVETLVDMLVEMLNGVAIDKSTQQVDRGFKNDPGLQSANPANISDLLSPPLEITESMNQLHSDCKNILQEFDGLLKTEGLQLLVIDNPLEFSSAEGSDSESSGDETEPPKKQSLLKVVMQYRKKYHDLETDCRLLMRDLKSYAALQAIVLPHVERNGPHNITLRQYVDQNISQIKEANYKAKDMEGKHTLFKREWENLQYSLERQLREEQENFNVAEYEAKLKSLPREEKRSNVIAALQKIGAMLCFKLIDACLATHCSGGLMVAGMTISPGLSLVGAGAFALLGLWLDGKSVEELEQSNKLRSKLEELKSSYPIYLEKIRQLERVQRFSKDIHETLCRLLQIFTQLGSNLHEALDYTKPTVVFYATQNEIINRWKNTEKLCGQYLAITGGGSEETSIRYQA